MTATDRGIQWAVIAVFVVGITAIYLADVDWLVSIGQEDGPVEYLTATIYGVLFFVTLYAFFNSAGPDNRFFGITTTRNFWLLLLALFFFICCGEELSWGQRIIGWGTPETWMEINGHGETNVHNLLDSRPFGFTADMGFAAICGAYTLALPLLNFAFQPLRRFIAWTGVPVPPLYTGLLFLMIMLAFAFYRTGPDYVGSFAKSVREYRELGYALIYGAVAFTFASTRSASNSDQAAVSAQVTAV